MGIQNYVPMQQSQGGVYDVDPALTAYVESVGQKLAAVSDVPLPYEFVVLNNSVPNAWALPGGKIAINRGLLTELQSSSAGARSRARGGTTQCTADVARNADAGTRGRNHCCDKRQ
jgi:predicted Zn-dependent protease